MTRRFVLIAAAVTTMLAGPAALAAHADVTPSVTAVAPTAAGSAVQGSQTRNAYGDWFCIVVYGTGVCQGDPLPDQLPIPQLVLPPLPLG